MEQIKRNYSFTQFLQSNDFISQQPKSIMPDILVNSPAGKPDIIPVKPIQQDFFDEHLSIDHKKENNDSGLSFGKKHNKKKQEKIELNTECVNYDKNNKTIDSNMTSRTVHTMNIPDTKSSDRSVNHDTFPSYSATLRSNVNDMRSSQTIKSTDIKGPAGMTSSISSGTTLPAGCGMTGIASPPSGCYATSTSGPPTMQQITIQKAYEISSQKTTPVPTVNVIPKTEQVSALPPVVTMTPKTEQVSVWPPVVTMTPNTEQSTETSSEPTKMTQSVNKSPTQSVGASVAQSIVQSDTIDTTEPEKPKHVATYETVTHDLGVLGKLEITYKLRLIDGRIAIDDRYLQGIQRAWTGDDRAITMEYIRQLICDSESFKNSLVQQIIKTSSGVTVAELSISIVYRDLKFKLKELIEKLKGADTGLKNLKETYKYDINIGISFDEYTKAISKICDDANKELPLN